MNGQQGGCLRLEGKYVSFPDIEDAENLIKYFRLRGMRSWESILNASASELVGRA